MRDEELVTQTGEELLFHQKEQEVHKCESGKASPEIGNFCERKEGGQKVVQRWVRARKFCIFLSFLHNAWYTRKCTEHLTGSVGGACDF